MKVGSQGALKRLGTRGRLPKEVFALEPSRNRASQERPCRPAPRRQESSALEAEDGLLCPRRSVDPLGSVTDHSGWQATQALSRDAPWMGDTTYGKDLPHIRFRASPNGQSWGRGGRLFTPASYPAFTVQIAMRWRPRSRLLCGRSKRECSQFAVACNACHGGSS